MTTKKCIKCNREKPTDGFPKRKDSKDGFRNTCKECEKSYHIGYHLNNKEKHNKASKTWYTENRDWLLEYNKEYYKTHKEEYKEYYLLNRERNLEANRLWHRNNPEKVQQRRKRYYEENKEKLVEKSRLRELRKRNAVVPGEELPTLKLLRVRDGDYCCYCNVLMDFTSGYKPAERPPSMATVEHILALKSGGKHTLSNTALACFRCNSSKNNTPLEDWKGYIP